MPCRLPTVLFLLGSGCVDSKILSDFDVHLVPRTPLNQDPITGPESLRLVLRSDRSTRILDVAEDATDGVHEGEPPLEETWLGVLVTDTPGTDLLPADVHAYGEVGPYSLSRGDPPITAEVLVAEIGRVGELERLDAPAFGAAAAMTADGDVWLFGGHGTFFDGGAPTQAVRRLVDLDAGDWRFADVGVVPEQAAIGATATLVDWNGVEAILFAGGRARLDGTDANLGQAAMWTPADGTMAWADADAMRIPRSGHRAVRLSNGRVLLVGGHEGSVDGGAPDRASFEIFDPGFQVFNLGSRPLDVPGLGFGLADVGPEGILVCGGHTVEDRGEDGLVAVPSDACNWISSLGEVTDAAPLPAPRTGLALAAVGDRHVLAVGGFAGEHAAGEASYATATVWLYTLASNGWQPLDDLPTGRAHHAAIPMPDGRVVIVGGTDAGGPLADAVGAPVGCTVLYDPEDRSLTEIGCSGTGAGADPVVAWHRDHGALVFTGRDDSDGGGAAYGIVPFSPPL